MIIRDATMDDALAIINGAKAFAEFTGLPLFPENEDDFIAAVSRIVTNDNVEVLIAEHDNTVIGGIGIVYGQFLWNPAIIMGEELFWWANPGSPMKTGKMLFDEAIRRMEDNEAIPFFKSLANSPESVDKLYLKEGFTLIEKSFMRIK